MFLLSVDAAAAAAVTRARVIIKNNNTAFPVCVDDAADDASLWVSLIPLLSRLVSFNINFNHQQRQHSSINSGNTATSAAATSVASERRLQFVIYLNAFVVILRSERQQAP